jgi:hypothetical protein
MACFCFHVGFLWGGLFCFLGFLAQSFNQLTPFGEHGLRRGVPRVLWQPFWWCYFPMFTSGFHGTLSWGFTSLEIECYLLFKKSLGEKHKQFTYYFHLKWSTVGEHETIASGCMWCMGGSLEIRWVACIGGVPAIRSLSPAAVVVLSVLCFNFLIRSHIFNLHQGKTAN